MTEDSLVILDALREARLGWIADELAEGLALGRQITKQFVEEGATRKITGTTVQPFSSEEEMEIIVETLAQYFIMVPRAWESARLEFGSGELFSEVDRISRERSQGEVRQQADGPPLGVGLAIAGENGESFAAFTAAFYRKSQPRLHKVLAALWPNGEGDFNQRYFVRRDEQ